MASAAQSLHPGDEMYSMHKLSILVNDVSRLTKQKELNALKEDQHLWGFISSTEWRNWAVFCHPSKAHLCHRSWRWNAKAHSQLCASWKSNTSFKGNNNWATEIAAATSQHKGGLWTAFKCWSQIMVFFTALLILIEPSLSKAAFTKWSGFYQQEQQRQTWRFIKRNKYRGKKEKWTQITKLEH